MTTRTTERPIPWALVLGGAAIVFVSMGTRQSFGIFLRAITEELGTGRESFSLAVAILNLMMGVPLAGYLADRYGHRQVLLAGAVIYGAAMYGVSEMQSSTAMVLLLGVVAGVGLSALSMAIILSAVGRLVPVRRRTSLLGLVTAGTSLGMFMLVPAAQFSLDSVGWRSTFVAIAGSAIVIGGLSFLFPLRHDAGAASEDVVDEAFVDVIRKARRNRSYLLLLAGFFVCGFHVGFIATHLPAYLADGGVSGGPASLSLALIGLMNIVGSTVFGRLGDRFRRRTLLSVLYGTRAVLMIGLLLVPLTPATAIAFGASIGFVWLATAPLTSATVAYLLGARYLSTLFGVVFFSHQVGSFLGVWLGGRVFDLTGSYQPIWLVSIGLAFLSMLIHLPIDDRASVPHRIPVAEGATA
jgi:predicted MFS family arabinose efflux permease